MNRRGFIKCSGALCLTIAAGSLLPACRGTRHLDVKSEQGALKIPLTELGETGKRKNIILRSPATPFPVLLRVHGQDRYHALLLQCPHQNAELTVSGDLISCPAHGSEFDAEGKLLQGPAETGLRVLPVRSDKDHLYIMLA